MRWIGLREGALLAAVASLGLSAYGWAWPVAVWWGLGCVAGARAAGYLLDRNLPDRRGALWTGVAAAGGYLLMAVLAVGGISAGLPALGVVAGLGAATGGLWARAWSMARST